MSVAKIKLIYQNQILLVAHIGDSWFINSQP